MLPAQERGRRTAGAAVGSPAGEQGQLKRASLRPGWADWGASLPLPPETVQRERWGGRKSSNLQGAEKLYLKKWEKHTFLYVYT